MSRTLSNLMYPVIALLMGSQSKASPVLDLDCGSIFAADFQMKAVGLTENLPITESSSLKDLRLPAPKAGPKDLVVRVEAVSVNPVDTKHRKRVAASETNPAVLGWDVAGIVESVGSEVHNLKKGDQVFYAGSISRAGGNSEYHAVDHRLVAKKPSRLSFTESAALPLTALTAYEGLFEQLQVKAGGTILVIGGAGGVGSMVIQMAKIAGLRVIATASRPESIEWTKKNGRR
jgi:NADPH2:quinone reductase